MGWTTYHRAKGQTDREHFAGEWPQAEILDCATVGRTFYAAVKRQGSDEVFAIIVLTRWFRGDYYNFGVKEMDESMGPNEARCPVRILDLLSPTTHEYALEWRQACRDLGARRATAAKVKRGDRVRFAEPLRFRSGAEHSELIFVARNTFAVGHSRFSIPGWRDRTFEIVNNTQEV